MRCQPIPLELRFFAMLLVLGGLVGILTCGFSFVQLLQQERVLAIPILVAISCFGWSVVVGVRLWRDRLHSRSQAAWMFASQIPVIQVTGLVYYWHTGLAIQLLIDGMRGIDFEFGLGSTFGWAFDVSPSERFIGVNLLAAAAFVYLRLAAREQELDALLLERRGAARTDDFQPDWLVPTPILRRASETRTSARSPGEEIATTLDSEDR